MKTNYIGKVKYTGEEIPFSFTNGRIYNVIVICDITGGLFIEDDDSDEGDGYLFDPNKPRNAGDVYRGGRFEIVEDDENKSLEKAIYG